LGKPLDRKTLGSRILDPVIERARIKRLKFHYLRHSCASIMLGTGSQLQEVSKLLGHSSPEVTMKLYWHFLPEREKPHAVADLSERIFGGKG